jgi:hypothetical protein
MSARDPVAIPEEHRDFVEEFRDLLRKYPKSAGRFRLADLGENPPKLPPTTRWEVHWECTDAGEFGMDCRPVAKPEE